MHPKGIEFEMEHRCQYNRESSLSGCSSGVCKDVCTLTCEWPCCTLNEATLFKDRKLSVGRAGTLNQPMGMDSSGQVRQFH